MRVLQKLLTGIIYLKLLQKNWNGCFQPLRGKGRLRRVYFLQFKFNI